MENNQKILMVVYEEFNPKTNQHEIAIKSQLSPKLLREVINVINSVLQIEDNVENEQEQTDIVVNESVTTTANRSNVYGDPDLLKVDQVLSGSIIDPLKK